jgi:type III pantothenate kinase
MLLAIDIGNTNTSFAVFKEEAIIASWRTHTDSQRTADDYAVWLKALFALKSLDFSDIHAVVIASVVPESEYAFKCLVRQYFHQEPLYATAENLGIVIDLPNKAEVGADRLVNAVAAVAHYGAPAIIIDFGTATTFDVVNEKGHYAGGAIAPGLNLSLEALYHHAAKLPKVPLIRPAQVLGTSTVTAMQSGLYWGYIGLVEGLLKNLLLECFSGTTIKIISTGGLGSLFHKDLPLVTAHDPDLTLKGLYYLFNRIKGNI